MLTLLLAAALAIPPAAGTTPTGAAPMTMLPALPTLPAADRPGPDERIGAVKFARALQATTPEARIKGLDDALLAPLRPTPVRGLVVCERARVMMRDLPDLGNVSAATGAAADECQQLRPRDPHAIARAAGVAENCGDYVRAANLLLTLIKIGPKTALATDNDEIDAILRRLTYADKRQLAADLLVALLNAGYDGGACWTSSAAAQAVRDLVATGDLRAAIALLPRVTSPADGLKLLIDRRLAPIWEDMAAWASDGFVTQRDATVRIEQAAFDGLPSPESRSGLADALASAGRRRAAVGIFESRI